MVACAPRDFSRTLLDDVNAMSQRLDALERMLGRESDARDKA
jgi:hypothetical protein